MARSFEVIQQISKCSGGQEKHETNPALDPALQGAIKAAMDKRDELSRQLPGKAASLKQTPEQTAGGGKQKPAGKSAFEIFQAVEALFGDLQERLAVVLNASLNVLQGYWETHCLEERDALEKDEKQVIVYCQPEKTDEQAKQIQRLEEFVALRYVAFIRCVLGHIKYLLVLLVILFSLALISLNVYSFEPHQSLVWSFTAIFAVMGLIVLVVLAQVHKDPILSRITGTKPNELGLDFYYRIASLGAVPLLTLLATHFPAIGHYLSSFFQPGLGALK